MWRPIVLQHCLLAAAADSLLIQISTILVYTANCCSRYSIQVNSEQVKTIQQNFTIRMHGKFFLAFARLRIVSLQAQANKGLQLRI